MIGNPQSSTTIAPMGSATDNLSGENLQPVGVASLPSGQAAPYQIVSAMTAPSTAPPYRFLPEAGTNSADGGRCFAAPPTLRSRRELPIHLQKMLYPGPGTPLEIIRPLSSASSLPTATPPAQTNPDFVRLTPAHMHEASQLRAAHEGLPQ